MAAAAARIATTTAAALCSSAAPAASSSLPAAPSVSGYEPDMTLEVCIQRYIANLYGFRDTLFGRELLRNWAVKNCSTAVGDVYPSRMHAADYLAYTQRRPDRLLVDKPWTAVQDLTVEYLLLENTSFDAPDFVEAANQHTCLNGECPGCSIRPTHLTDASGRTLLCLFSRARMIDARTDVGDLRVDMCALLAKSSEQSDRDAGACLLDGGSLEPYRHGRSGVIAALDDAFAALFLKLALGEKRDKCAAHAMSDSPPTELPAWMSDTVAGAYARPISPPPELSAAEWAWVRVDRNSDSPPPPELSWAEATSVAAEFALSDSLPPGWA